MKYIILLICFVSSSYASAATVQWIDFLPWDMGNGLFSPNRLAVVSTLSNINGGQGREESAWVVGIQNPIGNDVVGDITVEVESGKAPNPSTSKPFMVGQMIENTVYRIHVRTAGRNELESNSREQFLIYFGPKNSIVPPIDVSGFRNQFWQNITTAEAQLTEGMKTYRRLCAEKPVECKSGHFEWTFRQDYLTPTQEHNRKGHLDSYFEMRTASQLENEAELSLMNGADLSTEKKKQLLGAYQTIAERYIPRQGAKYEVLYLNKVKRNARLLKLDIQAGN